MFHQLLNYNKQNQCPYKHYLYPSPVTGAHFTLVDQGDWFFPLSKEFEGDIEIAFSCIHDLIK